MNLLQRCYFIKAEVRECSSAMSGVMMSSFLQPNADSDAVRFAALSTCQL